MPELPEVQTIINYLKPKILNQKIVDIKIHKNKILKNCSPTVFKKSLLNQKFIYIDRLGKYLLFHLTNKKVIVLHLRMEGKPYYQHKNDPYDVNHVLLQIQLDNDYELRYHDTRRFGTVHLLDSSDYHNQPYLKKIALDPTERKFNQQYVIDQLQKSPNRKIKTVLLDQTKISGIGNIYADEILFYAKIHPEVLVKNLNKNDFCNIHKGAKKIIKSAIKNHGTTILSFKYKQDKKGNYQNKLKVHTRKNLECFSCRKLIEKIKVNGRGTYLCTHCQHKK